MITYSNLFEMTNQADGMVRVTFKAADPTQKVEPAIVQIIYFTQADAKSLSEGIASVLAGKPVETSKMN